MCNFAHLRENVMAGPAASTPPDTAAPTDTSASGSSSATGTAALTTSTGKSKKSAGKAKAPAQPEEYVASIGNMTLGEITQAAATAANKPAQAPRNFGDGAREFFFASDVPVPAQVTSEKTRTILRDFAVTLAEINGGDTYSTVAISVGTFNRKHGMVLPKGMAFPKIPAAEVCRDGTAAKFKLLFTAQVYALNKARAPAGEDAIKWALLRMEAVKSGWFENQTETRFVDPVADAVETFVTDTHDKEDQIMEARQLAHIVPLSAEFVFRVTGHHFLSHDKATYTAKYAGLCAASLVTAPANYLQPENQYHAALHWVGPKRIREVLIAQIGTEAIPPAIALRAYSCPSGTAPISTTVAVLDAMSSFQLEAEFAARSGLDLIAIRQEMAAIKKKPEVYHKAYHAYGTMGMSAVEKARLEEVLVIVGKAAPVVQGFIDAIFQDSSLSRAKSLFKYAGVNPGLRRQAVTLFRQIARKEVTSMKSLFSDRTLEKEEEELREAETRAKMESYLLAVKPLLPDPAQSPVSRA